MESLDGYSIRSDADVLALLPNGEEFVLKRPYTGAESKGAVVRHANLVICPYW